MSSDEDYDSDYSDQDVEEAYRGSACGMAFREELERMEREGRSSMWRKCGREWAICNNWNW
jgi:hypothetical protein